MFKDLKIILTPMLSSLSLLNNVEIDSEEEMLGYGDLYSPTEHWNLCWNSHIGNSEIMPI